MTRTDISSRECSKPGAIAGGLLSTVFLMAFTACSSGGSDVDSSAEADSVHQLSADDRELLNNLEHNGSRWQLGAFHADQTHTRHLPGELLPRLLLSVDADNGVASTGHGAISTPCEHWLFDIERLAPPAPPDWKIDNPRRYVSDDVGCTGSSEQRFLHAASTRVDELLATDYRLRQPDQEDRALLTMFSTESVTALYFQMETAAAASDDLPLVGSRWTLDVWRSDHGSLQLQPVPVRPSVQFQLHPDGRLSGHLACRQLDGRYTLSDAASVLFDQVSLDAQACSTTPDHELVTSAVSVFEAILASGFIAPQIRGDRMLVLDEGAGYSAVFTGLMGDDVGTTLPVKTLLSGDYGEADGESQRQREVRLIRDQPALDALWREIQAHSDSNDSPPMIDFSTSVVVLMQLGLRGNLGESIHIRSANLGAEELLIEVVALTSDRDDYPLDSCAYDAALSDPFVLVEIRSATPITVPVSISERDLSSCSGL